MHEDRKLLSLSAEQARRLVLLAESGVELRFLEWTFGRPAAELEAALEACRPDDPAAEAEPERPDDDAPPLPSPPLRLALEALGERVTATLAGYALDGVPASIPGLIGAARAAGTRIPYPGIDPLPGTFAAGPSARRGRRRRPATAHREGASHG